MQTCKPGWSANMRKWITNLVDLSLRSSVGKFKEIWNIQKNEMPTGGSLCVQLANIAVFYVMKKAVDSSPALQRQ